MLAVVCCMAFFFSSRRRHTRCVFVTGVQTCALPISAVELFDSTMIELSRDIAMFRPVVDRFVRGAPGAILLVEFAEEDQQENLRRLAALGDMMAQLGFRWGDEGKREGGVVEAVEADFQKQIGRAHV